MVVLREECLGVGISRELTLWFANNGYVTMEKICKVLECTVDDIVEIIPNSEE